MGRGTYDRLTKCIYIDGDHDGIAVVSSSHLSLSDVLSSVSRRTEGIGRRVGKRSIDTTLVKKRI